MVIHFRCSLWSQNHRIIQFWWDLSFSEQRLSSKCSYQPFLQYFQGLAFIFWSWQRSGQKDKDSRPRERRKGCWEISMTTIEGDIFHLSCWVLRSKCRWNSQCLSTSLTEFAFASSEKIWTYICVLHEINELSKEYLLLIAKVLTAEVIFAKEPSHNYYRQKETAI